MTAVDTLYRVAIERQWSPLPSLVQVNVLWFRVHAGTDLGASDLAQDVRTTAALDTALRAIHMTNWTFTRVTAQQMLPTLQDPVESRYPANVTGSSASIAAPPLLTIVLTLRTAQQGRSHRGRTVFSPGMGIYDITATNWHVNIGGAVNAWAAAMHVRYVPAGPTPWTWGLWSSKLGGKPPNSIAGFQQLSVPPTVTSLLVRALRRREK